MKACRMNRRLELSRTMLLLPSRAKSLIVRKSSAWFIDLRFICASAGWSPDLVASFWAESSSSPSLLSFAYEISNKLVYDEKWFIQIESKLEISPDIKMG